MLSLRLCSKQQKETTMKYRQILIAMAIIPASMHAIADSNMLNIVQDGDNFQAGINVEGTNNNANINQQGSNAFGWISQYGDSNMANIIQQAAAGGNAVIYQGSPTITTDSNNSNITMIDSNGNAAIWLHNGATGNIANVWQTSALGSATITQDQTFGALADIDQSYGTSLMADIAQRGLTINLIASIIQTGDAHTAILDQTQVTMPSDSTTGYINQSGAGHFSTMRQVDTALSYAGSTQTGLNQEIFIEQAAGIANYVNFTQDGADNFATLTQYGNQNTAYATQINDGNNGHISQSGDWNEAEIDQQGSFNTGVITQSGLATFDAPNHALITQTGMYGNTTVTQNGIGNWAEIMQ